MKRHFPLLAVLFITVGLLSCGKPKPQTAGQQVFPPNMAIFHAEFNQVWEAVLKTVEYDFMLPVEIANRQKGYFITELVRDYQDEVQKKYRLTGSLKFEGEGIVVVLYQEIQVLKDEVWVGTDTDYGLENAILKKTASKLPVVPNKAKR